MRRAGFPAVGMAHDRMSLFEQQGGCISSGGELYNATYRVIRPVTLSWLFVECIRSACTAHSNISPFLSVGCAI